MSDDKQERARRQREYRKELKEQGYRRLEITIPPDVWERMESILEIYGGDTHPGYALVAWLGAVTGIK